MNKADVNRQIVNKIFEDERIFKVFFDNSIVGHSITFPNGKFHVNEAFSYMLGYTVEELEQLNWQAITHEDDIDKSTNVVKDLLLGLITEANFKKRYIKKNGQILYTDIFVSIIPHNADDKVFLTTIIDINDKEKYKKENVERESIYRTFIDSSDNLISIKDKDSKYIVVNQAFCDFFNVDMESVIGKTNYDFMDIGFAKRCTKTDKLALESDDIVLHTEHVDDFIFETRKFKINFIDGSNGIGNLIKNITNEHLYLNKSNKKSEIYKEISECFSIKYDSEKDQIDFSIKTALSITESKVGLLVTYDEKSKDFYVKSSMFDMKNEGMNDMSLTGAKIGSTKSWNHVINANKPLIYNDKKSIDDIFEFPAHHIDIENIMTIPIHNEDKIVAVVYLANKSSDYNDDDIQAVKILMMGMWNIVERQRNVEKTKWLLKQRNAMFNTHGSIMLIIDINNGNILDCNPSAVQFYGYTEEEFMKLKTEDLIALKSTQSDKFKKDIEDENHHFFTMPHKLKSGEVKIVDIYSTKIKYYDTDALYSIIFDVTDREKYHSDIKYLSRHDSLTGLYNRRTFEAFFEERDIKSNYPLALVMGDVNSLKVINDTFGHNYGDILIKRSGELLRIAFCDDLVARVGGDEFAVLITNADESKIRKQIEHLNELCSKEDILNADESILSIALGYSVQDEKKSSYEDLMTEAESFVYASKYFDSRSIKNNTVNIIMDTLFEKSAREKNHSNRVGQIASIIAEEMKLSINDVNKIKAAGYLHDIGKIGINESILNKPGRLDDDEWIIMKSHVERSYRILNNSIEFYNIANIVRNHHERIDGYGYPRGIKGEDIPLESKILTLADSFDAMTNYRTYKKRMTFEEAKHEILRCKGTQFDSQIVDVFMGLLEKELIK